jgi:hypothetical protein
MARRTVSATFEGGMISDEPRPGTARYVENYIPRADGLYPLSRPTRFIANATALSTATAVVNANHVIHGWSAGGTYHPSIGFVGFVDVVRETSAPTSLTSWHGSLRGFGMDTESGPTGISHRALVKMSISSGITDTLNANNLKFPDNGFFSPLAVTSMTSTATGAQTSAFSHARLEKLPEYIKTSDEVLIVRKGLFNSQDTRIYRYAGATYGSTVSFGTGEFSTAAGNSTGYGEALTTGAYTDRVIVRGAATAIARTGAYITITCGGTSGAAHTQEFFIKNHLTNEAGMDTVGLWLDKKILVPAASRFFRVTAGNSATLHQDRLTSDASPWALNISPGAKSAASYHGGRLFLANGSRISWSATVDETYQSTATGHYSTSTASTTFGTTGTFGVEFNHINLWSTSGFIDAKPDVGGDIVGLVSSDDGLVILKRNAILKLFGGVSYDGESSNVSLQVISSQVGPDSEYSWTETRAGIFFCNKGSIWMYDGNELVDITSGSVRTSLADTINSHRDAYGGRNQVKLSSDSDNVYISLMRHEINGSGVQPETAMTTAELSGASRYNKHLVFSIANGTWTYMSHPNLNTPASVVEIPRFNKTGLMTLWLGSWRKMPSATGLHAQIEMMDIENVFHRSGIVENSPTIYDGPWSVQNPDYTVGNIVTHPLLGYGNMKAVRPRSVHLKRTATREAAQAVENIASISLNDHDSHFVPPPHEGLSPPFSAFIPVDANGRHTAVEASGWQMRTAWPESDIGEPSWVTTGIPCSLVDKVVLTNVDSMFTAPTIHYSDPMKYGLAVHAFELGFDEVENRTDR